MYVPLMLLLLSCSLSLSGAGVVLENELPVLYGHAPSQLADLPITDGVFTPDPWNYLQRMSFFRLLIASTNPFMTSMGPGENQNPLWGMPLRYSWMLTSGRLADPTGLTTCGTKSEDMCIFPNSWWGCMHYYSSAVPFLAAAHNGFLGEKVFVNMQNPAGEERFCSTSEVCKTAHPDLMAQWDMFFKGLLDSKSSTLPDDEKKDAILGLYWNAQVASWHQASVCNDKLKSYSTEEKAFAEEWLIAVEYSAVAHFHSSLDQAPPFITPLPSRVLKEGDVAPNISDLTAEENHLLNSYAEMNTLDRLLSGTLMSMWRKAMCSPKARERGQALLKDLMLNPNFTKDNFIRVLMSMSSC